MLKYLIAYNKIIVAKIKKIRGIVLRYKNKSSEIDKRVSKKLISMEEQQATKDVEKLRDEIKNLSKK